jgi:hypothetical protein
MAADLSTSVALELFARADADFMGMFTGAGGCPRVRACARRSATSAGVHTVGSAMGALTPAIARTP